MIATVSFSFFLCFSFFLFFYPGCICVLPLEDVLLFHLDAIGVDCKQSILLYLIYFFSFFNYHIIMTIQVRCTRLVDTQLSEGYLLHLLESFMSLTLTVLARLCFVMCIALLYLAVVFSSSCAGAVTILCHFSFFIFSFVFFKILFQIMFSISELTSVFPVDVSSPPANAERVVSHGYNTWLS